MHDGDGVRSLRDVLVVGAGPAGAVAAREVARRTGGDVLLIERARMPRTKTCGGGISPRARKLLEDLGLWERVAQDAYPVRGLWLTSPSGRRALLAGRESAWVLDRGRLDTALVAAAVESGVQLLPETTATGLVEEGGRIVGVRCKPTGVNGARPETVLRARTVVFADGVHTLARARRPAAPALQTCMGWYEGVPFTPGIMEMYFDRAVLPHYAWLFPEAPDRVNIGLCVTDARRAGRSVRTLLAELIEKHLGARMAQARPLGTWRGHPIPLTVALGPLTHRGALLLGDAARIANPATGEGISHAIRSGMLAAEAIRRGGLCPEAVAEAYESSLAREMGWRVRAARLFAEHGTPALDAITYAAGSALVRNTVQRFFGWL